MIGPKRHLVRLLLAVALIGSACGSSSSSDESARPSAPATTAPTLAAPRLDLQLTVRSQTVELEDLAPRRETEVTLVGGCNTSVAAMGDVSSALESSAPGDVVCVTGDHPDGILTIEQSGQDGSPLSIVGNGATVAGIDVTADHVVIVGFDVTGDGSERPGVEIDGGDIVIDGLRVTDPGGDGIACGSNDTRCERVVIADSIVSGADGTGIIVWGADNRITGNEISGSKRVLANDADGIRFFGQRHLIAENLIHSIFDRGYEDEGPHTDCFQTFDNSKPPTVDVVIEGNVCFDVDHQCLIATAEQSGVAGEVGRSGNLIFRNNICANNGSQAILLQQFPGTVVHNNLFLETIEFQGIAAQFDSTDVEVFNNVFVGDYLPYLIDDTSSVDADHNLHDADTDGDSPVASEPAGQVGVEPQFDFGGPWPLAPAEGSPLVDSGQAAEGGSGLDATGSERTVDGDGDGEAVMDLGPYERG